ncbi:MAG: patatin-like phospholipase family protein [Moraxellaceae bacterium]|jgi:NTE family protein|nr:patatin-like phospholipase family protein [Moraxellaceae bacterium]MBK8326621.1 patatin-like phospholipase family protein [Moraxellaceae bacterium]MBK9185909.1 patatin-like phospholipase family protein [Moraxellaceae bacterium]HQV79358.1 patatin-like phospholipase family protein [Agitococcus sp.]
MIASSTSPKVGLVLSGGGARAAYQVGVLKAISELSDSHCSNPFPIICGTSAGGLNAAGLACRADCLSEAVSQLEFVWSNFKTAQVYRTDWMGVLSCAAKFLWTVSFGRLHKDRPVSLLNNSPLYSLLERELLLSRLSEMVTSGYLNALCITASGYSSGESVSFFQARADIEGWKRARRVGVPTLMRIEHLLASAAIPLLFPAVHINREYFGDGALRQLAPISPALHLGAEKILVIGVSNEEQAYRERVDGYPSIAQTVTSVLNSSFIDSLESDLERLHRINKTISHIPPEIREKNTTLRHIETLVIAPPSKVLDQIAMNYAMDLPRSIRTFVYGSGATKRGGAGVLSYLLFEGSYCKALIDLGYIDGMGRAEEIKRFLGYDAPHCSNVVPFKSA